MYNRLGRDLSPTMLDKMGARLSRDPLRCCRVAFDVPSAFIVLKMVLHRTKGITDGDIRVFMSLSIMIFMIRDQLGSRGSYLDAYFVDTSVTTALVRNFDDYPTGNYVGAESLEPLGQLLYTGFKSSRGPDTSPRGLS
jgi:hypothetical protein